MAKFQEPGAGALNQCITIRLRTDFPAQNLALHSRYAEVRQRWAQITPVGTGVYLNGVQTDHSITHRITLYFMAGITCHHEVVHRDTIYAVRRATDLNGRGVYSVLEVEEIRVEEKRTETQHDGGT